MDLLERDGVLQCLRNLVDKARDGEGQIALIRGEAGIGKTSVAAAFIESIADEAHTLWGRCDDLLAPRPLGPVVDMAFDEPSLGRALDTEDHSSALRALMDLFARALRPTVAVFEDVQWADGATLDLLLSAGRRIDLTHTLLVMTFRDEFRSDHPLSAVLGDLPRQQVTNICLPPLSREAVMSLSKDKARASRIWEISDGNPFFVSKLLDSPPGEIPISVTDAMRSQVVRLAGKGKRLVKLVSVVPGRMGLDLLDEIDPTLSDAIGEAEDLGLLKLADDTVSFNHELAREAIESSLTEHERRHLNMLVLDASESLGLDVSRSAHHAREARNVDAMVRLLPVAAKEAAEARSHREAVSHLEAIEPYLDRLSREDRAEIYELWATEEGLVSGRGIHHALAAAEAHRALGDQKRLGTSLLRAARSGWFSHETSAEDAKLAFSLAKRAIDELGDEETLAAAHAYLGHHAMVHIQHGEAIRHAKKALSLSPQPSAARCTALVTIGVVQNERDFPNGNSVLNEARELAGSLGLQRERWWAQLNLILGAMVNKEIDLAREYNEATRTEIGDDDLAVTSFHISKVAEYALMAGDYETAETTVVALSQRVDDSVWWLAWLKGLVDVRIGDLAAIESATRLRSVADGLGEPHPLFHAATLSAELLFVFGRKDEFSTARNLETLEEVVSFGLPWWIADLALWLWLDGHIDEIPTGAADPVLLLGSRRWEKAAEWYARRGLPYEQAIALSLGDEPARLEALRIVDRIGASALGSRFRRQLREDGIKRVPRKPRVRGPDNALGLTARQSEVLGLLARGLTNSEIGERLFISPRTVEKHVSAVLIKLGAANRREAVSLARAAGIAPKNG